MSQKEEQVEDDDFVGFFDETITNLLTRPTKITKESYGSEVKKKLIEARAKKAASAPNLLEEEETKNNSGAENAELARDLLQPEQNMPFKKDNILQSEFTEEEMNIVNQKIAEKRKQWQDVERRQKLKRVYKIQQVHSHVTEDEAEYALKENHNDEEEVCVYFTDVTHLHAIRKKIAMEAEKERKQNEPDIQDADGLTFISRPRKNKGSPSRLSGGKGKQKGQHLFRKLRLDDAIAQGNFEGWSPARIRAYQLREKNPNAYYYRFNDPGEKQRNGPWTKDEIELFYKRMKEVGVNGQWGVFARSIPGRVGYQCSNFYRQLIETGKIKDPNYYIDDKGKAHFIFKGGKKRASSNNSDDPNNNSTSENGFPGGGRIIKRKRREKGKKKKDTERDDNDDDDDDDDNDDEYRPYARRRADDDDDDNDGNHSNNSENPLPGFIDPITCEEVIKPAISPYGHVMSSGTWSRVLQQDPRNTCPFTKQPLKKRDLVVLTWENIDTYRDKIVNISGPSIPGPI